MKKTTKKEARRMLLTLARKLEKLPARRFKYNRWVSGDWKGRADLSCGTSACAAGWATTLPSFRAKGLRLKRDGYADSEVGGYITIRGAGVTDDSTYAHSLRSMARVLGIDFRLARYLFNPGEQHPSDAWGLDSPHDDAKPKVVAAHIRLFCDEFLTD
jgi:hypothetical protein